jgi:hypothetical protein
MSASPIEIVGEWLQNLLDPEVIHKVVAPDATYVSLNTEDSELKRIMPWAGTSHGPDAFVWNLTSSRTATPPRPASAARAPGPCTQTQPVRRARFDTGDG